MNPLIGYEYSLQRFPKEQYAHNIIAHKKIRMTEQA